MKIPVFDRAADYFRGDDSTLDASTPRELVEELRRALAERLGDKVVFFEGRAFLLSGTPREHFPTPELGDMELDSDAVCTVCSSRNRIEPAEGTPAPLRKLLPYIWGAPTEFVAHGLDACTAGRRVNGRIYRVRLEKIGIRRVRAVYLGSEKA